MAKSGNTIYGVNVIQMAILTFNIVVIHPFTIYSSVCGITLAKYTSLPVRLYLRGVPERDQESSKISLISAGFIYHKDKALCKLAFEDHILHSNLISTFRRIHSMVKTGVGVAKAPFVNFSVSKIFDHVKVHVRFKSHSYSTGVSTAELRRHLSNINAIFNS